MSRAWDKCKITIPHAESNLRHSDSNVIALERGIRFSRWTEVSLYHARNEANKIYFSDRFTLVKFPSCKLGFRRVNWFAGSPFCADFVRYQPHFKNVWSSVLPFFLLC